MTLLSIITRTFNGRPVGLRRNLASVDGQSDRHEIQHFLALDLGRHGVGWSFKNLATVVPQLVGDYVMLLDDDDYLIDNHFVRDLRQIVADQPDVVIVQMDMSNGRVLPLAERWEQRPTHSFIACSCYLVRRDVFNEHVGDFADAYDGDFTFINAVIEHGHQLKWWKRIVSKVGQVSNGSAE